MKAETRLETHLEEIAQQFDLLTGQKLRAEAELARRASEPLMVPDPTLTSLRWLMQTDDGWIKVRRTNDNVVITLPSHLKVSLNQTLSGRDHITILEGLWNGVAASLTTGFLSSSNPQHGAVLADFRPRVGGPSVIDGVTYDKQLTISHGGTTVGPYPALTDPSNPVPAGTQVVEIPDFPHTLGQPYGNLGTVWFRIGTTGDRYIHPGRVSIGCITCAPGNWSAIYHALVKARKTMTVVGDIRTQT